MQELVNYIDWTPFFQVWELPGRFPQILEDKKVGEQARELHENAQLLLQRIVDEELLEAGAVLNVASVTQALSDTLTGTPRDLTLIEGAGAWRVPLNEAEDFADLPRALRLPVILVVGLKLGCLNHARLTAEAIAADGLTLAGWVGSVVDSAFADDSPRFAANVALLKRALPAPCLGIIPHLATADAPTAQYYLSLDALLPLATQEATP
nr:vitamin B12 dependent-methionine synthase activation domain-containing protein [uncultured Halomonas sp.]